MAVHSDDSGQSRFYVDTGTKVNVPGVTSIIDTLAKPYLKRWEAKLAAELAVDSLDFIARMNETAGREATVRHLAGASYRTMNDSRKRGSELHDIWERMLRGLPAGRIPPKHRTMVAHFDDFLKRVQPELIVAEEICWSDTHEYAGSLDFGALVKLDENGKLDVTGGQPTPLVNDLKTGRLNASVALQMSAYANADRLIDADSNTRPMVDFAGGAVLHVGEDGWKYYPVRIDREVFEVFLHLRAAFAWDRGLSRQVVGKPYAAGPGAALQTGTQRRAGG